LHLVVSTPTHYFTVDVEEYFQVSAFENVVSRTDWLRYPSRVEQNVEHLLKVLARYDVRATFFILGSVARRNPHVVRAIAGAGHEIASHGWSHARVTRLTPAEFRADVRRAKRTLEGVAGTPVIGYRAPSFSITRDNDWALDVLIEEGYRYDSSLVPVRRPGYGYAGGDPDAHWIGRAAGRLYELPPATLGLGRLRLPAGGGAYFRLLPSGIVRAAFHECERRGVSGTFYLHPWELDPDQPRMAVPWWTRLRHYGGLRRSDTRLDRLLQEFHFGPIADSPALQ
jgi:polysaccharide deacetylase family protein (PEP-CTERM system associated)